MMEVASEKCRVCLKPEIPRRLLPLFDGESQHIERIFFISGVIVDDEFKDAFPDKICMRCSKALINATEVRALCLNSDKLLRQELREQAVIKDEDEADPQRIKVDDDSEEHEIEVHLVDEFGETGSVVICAEEPDGYETIEEALDESTIYYEETEKKKQKLHIEALDDTAEYLNDGYGGQFKVCEICGKIYTKNYISNHRKTHELEADKVKYHCDLCGLSFSLKCYTYSHMVNVHLSAKKYQCNICGKSYGKKYVFDCHQRTHSEAGRIFKCTYENCSKAFFTKNKLTVHARIHTNERPYTCNYCGRGFIHYTDHKRHVMCHTGERPFKCQDCPRGFIKKSELTAHQRTHRN